MTFHAPRILDAKGREIRVGDRVEREMLSGQMIGDEVQAFGWQPHRGVVVKCRVMIPTPTVADVDPFTYRCPDLQLLDDREESSNEH